MRDEIKNLTPEQALRIVMRLNGKGGAIGEAVLAEARAVLVEINLDAIADDVFFALDSVDVEECWDRAGGSRDGYTAPDQAAADLMDEELQPFFDQARRYHAMGMPAEEATYRRGVILGIYRYEHEAESEFRELAVDIPIDCAGPLLDEWRERGQDSVSTAAMDAFIRKRCPKWAGQLIRTGRRR